MTDQADDLRARGRAKMQEVYGFTVDDDHPNSGIPFVEETLTQVFGDLWSRPGLTVHERRLLTIGVACALGRQDILEIQFSSGLAIGELTKEQIDEIVLHLAYYAGWPNGTTALQASIEATRPKEAPEPA
jgi:alkylhydroperoxidase/carboxymuconolactone decarboxylase family protein YurZ